MEEDSILMHGDNLPIINLSKYNTEGKEAKYIQVNHIVGNLTTNKKVTEDNIKKAEFEFMLDLKTLISKTAYRSGTNSCQKQHATRRPRNCTRQIQAGNREAIYPVGPCVRR